MASDVEASELPDLTAEQARDEARELTERILGARDAYYGRNAELVDDATYDGWMQRLEVIERLYPELQGQDSPTLTVGAAQSTQFAPVDHAERMLSLDNVFSLDELREWCAKAEAGAGRSVRWLTELKIDGLAISLRYEDGILTSAATRGDGRVGEDVTVNAVRVTGIPQRLAGSGHPPIVEVRGEVFIPVAAFAALNELQADMRDRAVEETRARSRVFDEEKARISAERRFPSFANPRNAASGGKRDPNARQPLKSLSDAGVGLGQRKRQIHAPASAMCAKIIARYHTLQEHIYRVQNSPRVAARVWSQGARVWDVTLAADGLVHPAPFDNRFIGPNGLSMRPMGMRLIDHVNLLTKPGRFPYIMCIEKGTKLPPELTLLHERGDHFSLQTTQAVTPAGTQTASVLHAARARSLTRVLCGVLCSVEPSSVAVPAHREDREGGVARRMDC